MKLTQDVYKRIVAAKMYIDGNLQESIDLDSIAKQACFSRFHFHRLFAKIYRKTPHQYLTTQRVAAAQKLLSDNSITVKEISGMVGFESPSSFSILFKKGTGLAPHRYRNLAHQKKKESASEPKKFIPHCFIKTWSLEK